MIPVAHFPENKMHYIEDEARTFIEQVQK